MRKHTILGALGIVAASALALTGCSGGGDTTDGAGGEGSYSIGISQLVQHPALDAAAAGFQRAFTEAGIDATFDVQNANGEQATATTIAQKFASDGTDLVLAIATPAAQAAQAAITDKPVLFTAVTDPVEAGLVASSDAPGGNVTGTTDMNPVGDQIDLLKEIVPNAKTIGIVYASGEVNSQVQVALAKEKASELGIEVREASVATGADLQTALDSLTGVDAIYLPTDNLVTAGMGSVVDFANSNKVPLIGGEVNQVENGAIATLGLDYEALGYQTGQMAIKILTEGADPATMPVEAQTEFPLTVNPGAAEKQGVTIPEAVLSRAETTIE
ncbi:ABC transporter substrate-binding protein [Pseudoclavibacter chungangensis]|uniref:ABC transporter substrate-binding protein n=1 Tax=Pseudoclavibacter chungangensis TaxID=587635 RepID=A0A7J5BRX2_9MICO|nr:ABC transporter substrate-binding protein [Pseudoclavibacter chungangensis]KAB1655096.1 ABC transporter substrate-binding protein [Pseudoclavibacter chungangensis]NYJ66134.1 putative ABC transport system substrate-binding protein [Pseudoclavibacter chungangensis]